MSFESSFNPHSDTAQQRRAASVLAQPTTAYDVLVQRTDQHMATIVAHLEFDRNIPSKALSEVALRSTRNIDDVFVDVDLARLSADPELKVALNMFAVSSSNQLRVAVLQQQKARAVMVMLDPDAKRTEGKQP